MDKEEGGRHNADGEQGGNDYEDNSESINVFPHLLPEDKLIKFPTRVITNTIILVV